MSKFSKNYYFKFRREKIVTQNLAAATKSWKVVQDLREDFEKFKKGIDTKYNLQNKEINANIKRLNKELSEIKALRNAEYINYCIFINSK